MKIWFWFVQVRIKQCKRTIGIVRWLRKLGIEERLSWQTAVSGKCWWAFFKQPGDKYWYEQSMVYFKSFYSLTENYKTLHCKSL
jgi:hypothetical protein